MLLVMIAGGADEDGGPVPGGRLRERHYRERWIYIYIYIYI